MLVNGLIFIYSPSPKLTDVPVTNGLLVLHPSQTFSRRCINLQPERQARQLPLPRCSIRVSQWLFGRRLRTEGIGNNLNPSGIPPMSCANMCQLYNWGWYDPTDADFNTSTNPCHLFSWGSVQSLHVLRCCGKRERLESPNSADIQGNSRCLGLGRQTCGGTLDIEGWKLRWDPKHDFQEIIAYCSLCFHNMFLVFSRWGTCFIFFLQFHFAV